MVGIISAILNIMTKYLLVFLLVVGGLMSSMYAKAQDGPVLSASLDSQAPMGRSLETGAQSVDVARITLSASGGDVFLNGIYLATDVAGGLVNFSNIYLYDTYNSSLLSTYPNQSENPNLIKFGNVTIGNGKSKTYLIRASLASSAAGTVRVGFSGFTFSTQALPALDGVPIYGNAFVLPGATPTPVPTPTISPTVAPTPTPSPVSTPEAFPAPVKLYRKVSDPKVYVLASDGTLTWVKTLEEFISAGYKWADVAVISGSEFARLGGKDMLGVKGGVVLNVRKSASISANIVGKMRLSDSYEKIGESGIWFKIDFNGRDGWVHSNYTTVK